MTVLNQLSFVTIRKAQSADVPTLRRMQERSLSVLGRSTYTAEEIEAFLACIGTMDEAVVDEGHFFVAEDAFGSLVGSAAWSQLQPGYAASEGAPEHGSDGSASATVRSVFVDPRFARRGIASTLIRTVEQDALQHDILDLTLTATLSGLPFYRHHGWREVERKAIPLGGTLRFGCCAMRKRLAAANSNMDLARVV
jgi:GNAT superfamily N-acetyltransferase